MLNVTNYAVPESFQAVLASRIYWHWYNGLEFGSQLKTSHSIHARAQDKRWEAAYVAILRHDRRRRENDGLSLPKAWGMFAPTSLINVDMDWSDCPVHEVPF